MTDEWVKGLKVEKVADGGRPPLLDAERLRRPVRGEQGLSVLLPLLCRLK